MIEMRERMITVLCIIAALVQPVAGIADVAITNFYADFSSSPDSIATRSYLDQGTAVGSWWVNDRQESVITNGMAAFDQGEYSIVARLTANADLSSGVTVSYEMRSRRGAAVLYGKPDNLKIRDEDNKVLVFLQYSTTEDVGGLQIWNANSSVWVEAITNLNGRSFVPGDMELIEVQMNASGYTVWVNGMPVSEELPYNHTTGSQVGNLWFYGGGIYSGAWVNRIGVESNTESLRGVYDEVSKYDNNDVVKKYCFRNGTDLLMGPANTVQKSDSGEYIWYNFGTWNGASWDDSRYYNATNLEKLVRHPLTVVGGWGTTNFWESGWCKKNGKYAVYWSAWEGSPSGDPSSRIGVGIGTSPYGPFTNSAAPLYLGAYDNMHSINPYPFVDPDTGKVYLYWSMENPADYAECGGQKSSCIYGVELNANTLTDIVGTPVRLAIPDLDWEKGGAGGADRRWNESPIVFKTNGVYYLLYSARCFNSRDYCTGYATSSSPLGPFEEYDGNPFAWGYPNFINDVWSKVGMKTVIPTVDGEEMWAVYHMQNPKYYADTPAEAQALLGGGYNRVDPLVMRYDDTLAFNGPNIYYQSRPSGTMDGRNLMPGGWFSTSGCLTGFWNARLRDDDIAVDACFSQYDWVGNPAVSAANTWINRGFVTAKQVGVIMVYKSMEPSRYVSQVTATIQRSSGGVITTNIAIPPIKYAGAAGIASFSPELQNVTNICFSNFVLGPGATEVGLSEIKVMGKNM